MTSVRLGLRANAAQFSLLVGLNALVGAMVGLERSVLPLVGEEESPRRQLDGRNHFREFIRRCAGRLTECERRRRLRPQNRGKRQRREARKETWLHAESDTVGAGEVALAFCRESLRRPQSRSACGP